MKRRRMTKQKYKEAFIVACELLNGDCLYGWDTDRIFDYMMAKEHVVCDFSYMDFILDHLDELRGRGCK